MFSFLPTRLGALWEPDGRETGITMIKFSRVSNDRSVGETAAVPRFRPTQGHAYSASHSSDRGGIRSLNFVCEPARSLQAAW